MAAAPARPAAWFHQGTAFHAAVEMWERGNRQHHEADILYQYEVEYDLLIAADMERQPDMSKWMTGGRVKAEDDISRRRQRGLDQVKGYLDWASADPGRVWRTQNGEPALEVGFQLDLDGIRVVGAIDCVWQYETGEIGPRDWKTGSKAPDWPLQLGVYRLAIEELYGFLPKWGDFYLAKDNKPLPAVDLSRFTREWVTQQFKTLDHGIREGVFLPNPGPGCRTCGVAEHCTAIGDPNSRYALQPNSFGGTGLLSETRDDFVVSFKPHNGHDAPLLVFKAGTAAGLLDNMESAEATGLFAVMGTADKALKAAFHLGAELGATPVEHPSTVAQGQQQPAGPPQYAPPPQQPQQPQQQAAPTAGPPGMTPPTCPHGTKAWVTSKPGARRAWRAWFCPADRNDPDHCDPEWFR